MRPPLHAETAEGSKGTAERPDDVRRLDSDYRFDEARALRVIRYPVSLRGAGS